MLGRRKRGGRGAETLTRIYFASDLHGSEKCFRKFLNGATAYGADTVILGGDLAGKAILPLTRDGGSYHTTFQGRDRVLATDSDELNDFRRLAADHGYYCYLEEPGELSARQRDGTLEQLLTELMRERLEEWTTLAQERLAPKGIKLYWMLGNDDPNELEQVLQEAPWGEYADGTVLRMDDDRELATLGYANETPWHTHREAPEEQLEEMLDGLCAELTDPQTAILNFHVPPYDSGLDTAPKIDADFNVQTQAGQPEFVPVGSTAVRHVLERVQPVLSLHGHVHESGGFRRIGRTLAINPGSDYGLGTLNGALVTFDGPEIKAFQLVRG
jgi:Icc-related predicted phosphoesterase